MEKILQFLKDNPVFYFASVEGDKPKVRPFGFFMEYEGKLYFGMGKHKPSYAQVSANPNVEICTCSADGVWVRISGQAVFDDRQCVLDKVFEVMPGLQDIYSEKTGHTLGNFYLKNGVAEFRSMKGYHEIIEF